jgi:CRISPR-associated protein Csb2
MALAAAHFQTGADGTERAALEWLQQQDAPQIHAPMHTERPVVTQYVPVNDKAGPSKASLQSATGLTRDRQPRTFARGWLEHDTAYLVWPEVQPDGFLSSFEALCRKVTRIGHSTSLVQMWASQAPPERPVNWIPNKTDATERLRVTGLGTLGYLEQRFNGQEVGEFCELRVAEADESDKKQQKEASRALRQRFQNQPPVRLWPEVSLTHGYAPSQDVAEPSLPGTVFDRRLLIYALRRADGPYRHLDPAATLQLTGRFREALLQHLGANAPETLSGHRGEARSERPHMALLPLPFVGREHAHGGILGVAVAVPRDLEPAYRDQLLRALAAVRREGLKLGALGRWSLETPGTGASPLTLRDRIWTAAPAGARQWATVTPYVYDRHPKAKNKAAYQRELADAARESWQRVRQASDVSVEVVITPVSAHLGVPASHQFPRLARKDGSDCRHTHAILIFDRPVIGPVLLGAGRYRGYGLCRPLGGKE